MRGDYMLENKYVMDWDKYAKLARQSAAEGAVLIQNHEEVLPIQKGARISVFGRIQCHYYKSGTGSGGLVNAKYVVGILEGLRSCKEVVINEKLAGIYKEWIKEHPFDVGKGWGQEPWAQEEMPLTEEVVQGAAAESDLALVIIGRTAGEDQDLKNEQGSYLLTELEEEMLEKVCGAFKKVIVVLNVGGIINMNWMDVYHPKAVLYAWQGGMEGGNAVCDILLGKVNPSGVLSDTIAYQLKDYPASAYFGGEDKNFYSEDLYVGYRYFETVAKEKVRYPFGYGLSYTVFKLTSGRVELLKGNVRCSVEVTNVGERTGKKVVQIYVQPPQGQLGKPLRNLAAFAKTKALTPGERQSIELTVPFQIFASYDETGVTGIASSYVLEAGEYVVYAGEDVRNAIEIGRFKVEKNYIVERCTQALAPTEAFQVMHRVGSSNGDQMEMLPVVRRDFHLQERIKNNLPAEIAFTGDMEIQLEDVLDERNTMEAFIGQLSDRELACLVRGEGMCSPKVTPGTAGAFGGVTDELQKYGIPLACCADGPAGIRMTCGTWAFSLPNGTCLACTFNTELIKQLFVMVGAEMRANQIDTLLGPGMNIHRHPLNGRNFEYFSEDPLLTGKMAVAELQGMAEYGVTGTIKHFAANNQEYHRSEINSIVSERALREIYLKGFEIAIKEGNAMSIMTMYGALNGIWAAGNYDLLTTILRKEWGFRGIVMTDWWAKINEEGEEAVRTNTAAMIRGQNDLYMVVENAGRNSGGDNTLEALEQGSVTRGELQRSAINICSTLLQLPTMKRFLGRVDKEELKAAKYQENEMPVDYVVPLQVVGQSLYVNMDRFLALKNTSCKIELELEVGSDYLFKIGLGSETGDLAQSAVSVFLGKELLQTIMITGKNKEIIEKSLNKENIQSNKQSLKFYFEQGGLSLKYVTVQKA